MKKSLRLSVRAHAKVNLDLRIFGTRADGYHELRTVFQSIDLHDTLTCAERAGPFILKTRSAAIPKDHSNLVWKAAAALWKALGRGGDPTDTVVTIEKAIPMEAGLGGGSSDAAAALLGFARLWGGAPVTLLREVAAGIGADVPFFLSGGTALGLGRGEEIYPLVDLPTHWIVVICPGVRRLDRRSVHLVRRGPRRRAEGTSRAAGPAGPVAVASGADDQRPGAARCPPPS